MKKSRFFASRMSRILFAALALLVLGAFLLPAAASAAAPNPTDVAPSADDIRAAALKELGAIALSALLAAGVVGIVFLQNKKRQK